LKHFYSLDLHLCIGNTEQLRTPVCKNHRHQHSNHGTHFSLFTEAGTVRYGTVPYGQAPRLDLYVIKSRPNLWKGRIADQNSDIPYVSCLDSSLVLCPTATQAAGVRFRPRHALLNAQGLDLDRDPLWANMIKYGYPYFHFNKDPNQS
jgi:hypothetical protein